jgi:hypothetical protein
MPTNLPARRLYVDDEASERLQVFVLQAAALAFAVTGLLFSMNAGVPPPPAGLPEIFVAP